MKKLIAAMAVAALVAACADPSGPVTRSLLNAPSLNVSQQTIPHPGGGDPEVGAWGTVELCKESNVGGTFTFNISENGTADLLVSSPLDIVIGDGGGTECVDVYLSAVGHQTDPAETVTITETTADNLTAINIIQYLQGAPGGPNPYRADELNDTPAPYTDGDVTATLRINNDMARRVTFVNTTPDEGTGCTYTKGWYQNKNGSPTVIDLIDGRSQADAQAIFKATPGKPNGVTWEGGNNTLNLYQQLLAALNNLGGEANIGDAPQEVQDAINDALDATGGTGKNITLAAGTDVGALTEILANFNEGDYDGWPHCEDDAPTTL